MKKKPVKKPFVPKRFTPQEADEISLLSDVAYSEIGYNDKRVANAWGSAFEILRDAVGRLPEGASVKSVIKEFVEIASCRFDSAAVEFLIACQNTCQYERALEFCGLIEANVPDAAEFRDIRAELLALSGKREEAEKILTDALNDSPDDPLRYIRMGDLYGSLPRESRRDLDLALDWLYRGYDRGLAKADDEDGGILLERLADFTVDSLWHLARGRLVSELESRGLGDWRDVTAAARAIERQVGRLSDPPVAMMLLDALMRSAADDGEHDRLLGTYIDFMNLCPRDSNDGLSALIAYQVFQPTSDARRILDAKDAAMREVMRRTFGSADPVGAIESDFMSRFQKKYMEEKDAATGKSRRTVLNQETRRMEKLWDEGRLVWGGFPQYRNRVPEPGFTMRKEPPAKTIVLK